MSNESPPAPALAPKDPLDAPRDDFYREFDGVCKQAGATLSAPAERELAKLFERTVGYAVLTCGIEYYQDHQKWVRQRVEEVAQRAVGNASGGLIEAQAVRRAGLEVIEKHKQQCDAERGGFCTIFD